jgi:hypothetical protein
MNKELMMKAAVQFKGVWPNEEDFDRLAVCIKDTPNYESGDISIAHYSCAKEHWEIFCTREQFEVFVESLFYGAPEGATHYLSIGGSHEFLREAHGGFIPHDGGDWVDRVYQLHDTSHLLIPRPATKTEPEAPYMPQVGEECLAYEYSTQQNRESVYIGDDPRGDSSTWKAFSSITTGQPFFSDRYEFRPLKTEREKIRNLALLCGFKLEDQPSGKRDLNQYVYDFANALKGANSI